MRRSPVHNPGALFRIGMLALLASIVLMWSGRAIHIGGLPADLLDGARGLFVGISIACLIQSMRLQRRRPSGGERW